MTKSTLFIHSSPSKKEELFRLLNHNGFETEVVKNPQEALEKIRRKEFDLILCNNEIENYNGYNIYKMLKPEIILQSIPFVLVMEKYDGEDIMVALELGIDNLIFYPLNPEATLLKLKNQLIKKQHQNFLHSEEFKNYFNQSQVPMMLIRDGLIADLNPPLFSLNKDYFPTLIHQSIETVINIEAETSNALDLKRFKNGLINIGKFHKVGFKKLNNFTFDLLFFRGKHPSTSFYLVEILPVDSLERPKVPDHLIPGKKNLTNFDGIYHQSYPNNLTEREQQVLELSATGLPIKIIAHDLHLSKRTIEKHRANIMEKLGARNMIEAIVAWYKNSGTINSVSGGNKARLSTISSLN